MLYGIGIAGALSVISFSPNPNICLWVNSHMSTFSQTMVGAMIFLSSIYRYIEQNHLVNYTGYTERWG